MNSLYPGCSKPKRNSGTFSISDSPEERMWSQAWAVNKIMKDLRLAGHRNIFEEG